MSMFVGEALCGESNEVAHIDLLIGDKSGPVGSAFAHALANQKMGHSNLLAGTPNLSVKPSTVMITKVTIKGARQAVQMFGPAQKAVADAVTDAVVGDTGSLHLQVAAAGNHRNGHRLAGQIAPGHHHVGIPGAGRQDAQRDLACSIGQAPGEFLAGLLQTYPGAGDRLAAHRDGVRGVLGADGQ